MRKWRIDVWNNAGQFTVDIYNVENDEVVLYRNHHKLVTKLLHSNPTDYDSIIENWEVDNDSKKETN